MLASAGRPEREAVTETWEREKRWLIRGTGNADSMVGEAVVAHGEGGQLVVIKADPIIRVNRSLLDSPDLKPWAWDEDTGTLQLDEAGEYRYGYLAPGGDASGATLLFRRLGDDA